MYKLQMAGVLLVGCGLLVMTAPAGGETIHFREGGGTGYTDVTFDDGQMKGDNDTPEGDYWDLAARDAAGTYWRGALIGIKDLFTDLPATSGGCDISINSATLHLFRYSGNSSDTMYVYRVTANWMPDAAGSNEGDVSYEHCEVSESTEWASGDFSSSDYDSANGVTQAWGDDYNQEIEIDVTSLVEDIYDAEVNYGFVLLTYDGANLHFRSSERGDLWLRPSLEITCEYTGTTYTLTVNSGSGDGNYAESAVVDITAAAAPSGQQFDEWTGDTAGIANVNASSTTLTMPASNAEITATYEDVTTYTLTVNSGSGDGSYAESAVVDITADAAPSGQQFDEWTGDTSNIADVNDPTTTITMPASNAEITATYEDIPAGYALTVNSGSGDGSYSESQVVDITADAAASGKFFDAWTGDTANVADVNDPTTTITMPAADAEITATYADVASGLVSRFTFDIDARDSYGTSDGTLTGGASVTNDGTRGKVVSLDGTDDYVSLPSSAMAAGRSELTLSMWVKPDIWASGDTIWDEYAETSYWQFTVINGSFYTRDSSTGTTGSRNNDISMPSLSTGSWQHLAFVYSVTGSTKAIYLDGVPDSSTSTSIDTLTSDRDGVGLGYACDGNNFDGMIDDVRLYSRALNGTEIAYLAERTLYTLTVNSGSGDGSYVENQVVDISADSPASGQQFDEWIGDTTGIANVNNSSTTITMPAADAEITATYEAATTYSLTVNSGSGDGNYTQGTVVDIDADSPASGKQFDDWVGDTSGIANVNASSTTLTMPASNAEITATYEDIGGGPSVSGVSGSITQGSTITISGSSFGSEPSGVVFDDFELGTDGEDIMTGSGSARVGQWDSTTGLTYYTNDQARSGSLAFEADHSTHWLNYVRRNFPAGTSEVFVSYWVYCPTVFPGEATQDGLNWKHIWIQGDGPTDDDIFLVFQGGDSNASYYLGGNCGTDTLWTAWNRGDEMDSGDWFRGTFYAEGDLTEGYLEWDLLLEDGTKLHEDNVQQTWGNSSYLPYEYRSVRFNGYGRQTQNCYPIHDDCYSAYGSNCRARVEIGNASTYSSCTDLAICGPTSWSSSSITAKCNVGGLNSNDSWYLFVIDGSSTASAGKKVKD